MNKIKIFLLLSVLLIALQTKAQVFPDAVSPYTHIDPPATPLLPEFQGTVLDESTPSSITIRRVSELFVADDNSWSWNPDMEYAKIATWNADQTMYKFSSYLVYNAETHEFVRLMPGGQIYFARWSNTDPDLIYGFRDDGEIKAYSVATNQYNTIIDIKYDANTPFDFVKLGPGEGNIDKNDKYVAVVGKKGADLWIIVCDLEQEMEVYRKKIAGAWADGNQNSPKYIDWVSVSQSGDYVAIMWNHNTATTANPFQGVVGDNADAAHYGVELYSTADMSYLRRIVDYGNHGDFGYASNGKEVFVQFWGPSSWQTMNMYYLDGSGQVVLSSHSDYSSAGHVSCRNLLRPGWAYLVQSYASESGQMVAIKLDSESSNDQNVVETVEHFGHHFSTNSNPPLTVVSPKGDKVMFRSDWGGTAPANDILLFEATATLALPVELMTFKGQDEGFQHVLSWRTASELNTDYFSIEHSIDAEDWTTIGKVEATHNSLDEQQYFFKYNNFKTTNFYRLKTIDFDGSYEYSNIISLTGKEIQDSFVTPNPANNQIQLKNTIGRTHFKVFTASGVFAFAGIYNGQFIDITELETGAYFIEYGDRIETFIKQ